MQKSAQVVKRAALVNREAKRLQKHAIIDKAKLKEGNRFRSLSSNLKQV